MQENQNITTTQADVTDTLAESVVNDIAVDNGPVINEAPIIGEASIDPIQIAFDSASYDLKKYLLGEDFPKTVELIINANRITPPASDEINFICLMLALQIIKYDKGTGEQVMAMLSQVGLELPAASQVWSDIETYIIPTVPELGVANSNEGLIVNRDVPIRPENATNITHFGPDSVEMRLKSIKAPRITLDELSKGQSLLNSINETAGIKAEDKPVPKTINYDSHPDPYREMIED